MRGDRTRPERRQTYLLKGKNPYLGPDDTFKARAAIIAGVPPSLADLSSSLNRKYDPIPSLGSASDVDRYAAVRALAHRHDLGGRRTALLEDVIDDEEDDRVVLEAAGVAASLGSGHGEEWLSAGFDDRTPPSTIMRLVDTLASGGDRGRAAASAALAAIGSDEVITTLAAAAHTSPDDWILATLGRMPPARVRSLLAGDSLLARISPLLLTAEGANWLATEEKRGDLSFLMAQDLA